MVKKNKRGGGFDGGLPNGVPPPSVPIMTPTGPAMGGQAPNGEKAADMIPPPPVQAGGDLPSLTPALYGAGPYAKSQYYTISGGSRRRRSKGKRGTKSKRRHRKQRGGSAVLATAAVPFGLLALQRYFKGSKTSKKGVAKMGRSFKRTFRRRY